MDNQTGTGVDDLETLTHRVARVTSHPITDRIFFNRLGRSLEFEPGTSAEPGAAQDVPACVAEAIAADETLAPHFRCEPIESTESTPRRRGRAARETATGDQPAE